MFIPSICHLFSGMSEISFEGESGRTSGEDPQLDIEAEEEEDVVAVERLTDDVTQASVDSDVDADDLDGVMYEIDIDTTEDNRATSDKGVDRGSQSVHVVTCDDGEVARVSSVDNGGLEAERHAERAEAPEERGEADAETKVIFSLILNNQPLQAALHCVLLLIGPFSSLSALVVAAFALL